MSGHLLNGTLHLC